MAFDQTKPTTNGPLVSADVRDNLQHLKGAIAKEHNWSDTNPNASTHNMDVMNITVTGSTQRDTASGYDSSEGSGNIVTYVLHSIDGVPANTYSLRALLQELVNRSHRHTTHAIFTNCNCACACDCSGSCFLAGTLVLMANRTWKAIEEIKAGDKVIGIDGNANTVLAPYSIKLGNQRSIVKFCDDSLFWSAEHLMWVKSPEGVEYWGTHDYNQYLREKGVYEIEGQVYDYKGLTKKEPLIVTNGYRYGHLSGWLARQVVVDRSFDESTLVYSMAVDGSHSYIVNGYFATGFVDDTDFDYTNVGDFLIGKFTDK
jgi:hypothetical protein